MHALMDSLTKTPQYQAGGFTDEATIDERNQNRIVRMLSPDQMSRVMMDLTGFEWTWRGFNQLENDEIGYRVLGGGIDGLEVFSSQEDASLSWALVVLRMSQFAAEHAVTNELENNEDRQLFVHVTLDDGPEDEVFTDEIDHLHWRLYGERASDVWAGQIQTLWADVNANSGPAAAWKSVLSAMFSDPEFVSY